MESQGTFKQFSICTIGSKSTPINYQIKFCMYNGSNKHFWHAESLPELYEYKPLSGKQILK